MEQDPPKPDKRAATPSAWKPGQSGNPKGRPRSGLAFAERVRERVDPDIVINLALEVASDTTMSAERRLAALWPLIDRGFIKPPTTIAAHVQTSSTNARDWSTVPLEERRALLEQLRGAHNPKVLDGEAVLSPTVVALAAASTDED